VRIDFIRDLELSRTSLSGAWTAALAGTAITMPLFGRLVDRYGGRCILFVCSFAYILGLFLIGILPKGSIISVGLSFYFARSSMAAVQMIGLNITNQWWIKQKARAMAVTNATASWAIVFPGFLAALDQAYGWRDAMFVQGVLCGVILILLTCLTFNRPESYSYWPDASQRWDQQVPVATLKVASTEMVNMEGTTANGASHHVKDGNEPNSKYAQLMEDHDGAPHDNHDNGSVAVTIVTSPKPRLPESASQQSLAAAAATLIEVPLNGKHDDETNNESDGHLSTVTLMNGVTHSDSHDDDLTLNGHDNTNGSLTNPAIATDNVEEIHWHWHDALRTPTFWIVALAACALSLLWSGM
jgi:hypothetical protein